jgi:hypothetical protein
VEHSGRVAAEVAEARPLKVELPATLLLGEASRRVLVIHTNAERGATFRLTLPGETSTAPA